MQSASDLASGGIAVRVQHAGAAVGAFAGECELGAFAIELRAPGDEFLDTIGAFFDENACGLRIDEAVTGRQGVLEMQADLVFVAESDGDAALCVLRSRFCDLLLGKHENAAALREFDGGAQSCNSGADHDEIRLLGNRLHVRQKW